MATPTANAQSKDDIKQAKKQFNLGRDALKKKKSKEAIEAFTKAYELSKRSAILFYVGQAYDQDGQLLKARRYYQRYLDEVPDAPNAEDVLNTILNLQKRIRKAYARVSITTVLPGRDVFIKGEDKARCRTKDKTPCNLTLKPGKYTFIIKAGAGKRAPDQTKVLNLAAGQKETLKLELKEANSAKLLVKSDVEGATLNVAGKKMSLPLSAPIKLKPGNYPLVVKKPDGAQWKGNVTVKNDELSQIYVPLEHASTKSGTSIIRTVSYALIGTGAGLLIGGFWMGSQTSTTFERLEQQKQAGSIDPKLVEQGQSQQFAANTLIITGALAAVGGTGLFAWDWWSNRPKTAEPSEGSQEGTKQPAKKELTPDDDLL